MSSKDSFGEIKMKNIGFIGLGAMGGPMARNLVMGGNSVKGYDKDSTLVKKHSSIGGIAVNSSAEAASEVDFLFTMLPTHNIVEDALFGENGAIDSLSENCILIDMSTIHPIRSDEIRKKLADRKIKMIDSPIGRTSKEAAEGKSLLMVGAVKSDIAILRPLFELLGDTIIDCGGPGTGARMKIVNNYMTTVLNVLSGETLTLSTALGIDIDTCLSVLNQTPAGKGHLSTTYPAKVLKGDLSPAFMIDLAFKDLKIGNSISKELNLPLSLGKEATKAYIKAQEEGRGQQDWTAIFTSLLNQTKT